MSRIARVGLSLACGATLLSIHVVSAQAAVPTCWGKTATIVGTDGADHLEGTPGIDVIYGGGGDDWIQGLSTAGATGDLLCGGAGNDSIYGDMGSDKINGGDGDDRVNGEFGVDLVQGNAGNDWVADVPIATRSDWDDADDPGGDTLRGGIGNDVLSSGSGADKVYGEAGADRLDDYTHVRTYLSGGAGDDVFDATLTNADTRPLVPDNLYGDAGTDTARVHRHDVLTTIEQITYIN